MAIRKIITDNSGALPGAVAFESNSTGSPKPGGKVYEADQYGAINISTPLDDFLTVRFVGYEPIISTVRNLPPVINLQRDANLPEVEVTARRSYFMLGTLLLLLLIARREA